MDGVVGEAIRLSLIAFLVLIIAVLWRSWTTKPKPKVLTPIDEVNIRAAARWPRERFPCGISDRNTAEDAQFLTALMEEWHTPPRTEQEREENERRFWRKYANKFAIASETGKHLRPKQDISDFFTKTEPLIPAEFYAATGIYNRPYHGPEWTRLREKLEKTRRKLNNYSTASPAASSAESDYKAARDELEKYETVERKDYFTKWGGWFFTHVQIAFDEMINGPAGNYGPSGISDLPGGAADDETTYNYHASAPLLERPPPPRTPEQITETQAFADSGSAQDPDFSYNPDI